MFYFREIGRGKVPLEIHTCGAVKEKAKWVEMT